MKSQEKSVLAKGPGQEIGLLRAGVRQKGGYFSSICVVDNSLLGHQHQSSLVSQLFVLVVCHNISDPKAEPSLHHNLAFPPYFHVLALPIHSESLLFAEVKNDQLLTLLVDNVKVRMFWTVLCEICPNAKPIVQSALTFAAVAESHLLNLVVLNHPQKGLSFRALRDREASDLVVGLPFL